MFDLLIKNAGQILTCSEPGVRPPLAGRYQGSLGPTSGGVAIQDGRIAEVGPQVADAPAREVIDAQGGVVLPGFVDCHTHTPFVGSRAHEFEERLKGVSYEEILRRGGGIRYTMKLVRETPDDALAAAVRRNLDRFLALGTTTIEAKSGYGLSLEHERRQLRALMQDHPVEVISTCLAAHAVPPEFAEDKAGYLKVVCNEILPAVAREGLAKYCDVFCEQGAFNFEESETVLRAGLAVGLRPRVHAEQLTRSGGSRLACRVNAITADHLEYATYDDALAMKNAGVLPVLLPAANHVLDQEKRAPARAMIGLNLPVAIASDYNPGTAPTQSMPMVMNLAAVRFKMTIAETIVAATINGACAAGVGDRVGSLEPGKQADIAICGITDFRDLVYRFGGNPVRLVLKRGRPPRAR